MSDEKKSSYTFLGLYVTFCVLLIYWFIKKYYYGRRQINLAFEIISRQLQEMQERLGIDPEEDLLLLESANPEMDENTPLMEKCKDL